MIIKLSRKQWESLGKTTFLKKTADLGLYEFDTPKGKDVLEKSKKEFDSIVNSFAKLVNNWRSKYVHYGSKDTASKESQIQYIKSVLIDIL